MMNIKKKLRKNFSSTRDNLTQDTKKMWDSSLCEKLELELKDCDIIHSYLPFRSEPKLLPLLDKLIELGKTIVAPKTLHNGSMKNLVLQHISDIEYGMYNTPYPGGDTEFTENYFDVIIVPGLAFDLQGNRLGYGGGYYDRFLSNVNYGLSIAPCYPFQLIADIPKEKYDILVDKVVLPF